MLPPSIIALGLLAHPGQTPKGTPRLPDPGVRIWVSDTLYQVGAGAHVFVQLREAGYLVVLHVDAMGRIRLLYPVTPADQPLVPAGAPFEVGGATNGATFRVETRGRGTLLAARSPVPFQFDPLRYANRWDYERSLLLQPTAGNPFAAALDIADRVADGQPYDYDVTAYGTPGTLTHASERDSVCFSCLTVRRVRSAPSAPAAVVVSNSSVVDCSGANLVDSFCSVQDNRVSNVYTDNSVTEVNTVEVPVYVPFFVPVRTLRPIPPVPPPPPPAITIPKPLRKIAGHVVPPPPRPRPDIVIVQPTAPSHPDLAATEPAPGAEAPTAPPPVRVVRPMVAAATPGGMRFMARPAGTMEMGTAFSAAAAPAQSRATTIASPALLAPRTFVPSRAFLRSISTPRH